MDSWTPARHARRIRGCAGSGPGLKESERTLRPLKWQPHARVDWTRRKPRLLLRLSVVFLLRFEDRTFLGLLFHEPPRFTRWPPSGPCPLT
jgi:hypothetical protein